MSIICIQSINEKKNHIRYEVDTDSQPLGVGGMGSVFCGKRFFVLTHSQLFSDSRSVKRTFFFTRD